MRQCYQFSILERDGSNKGICWGCIVHSSSFSCPCFRRRDNRRGADVRISYLVISYQSPIPLQEQLEAFKQLPLSPYRKPTLGYISSLHTWRWSERWHWYCEWSDRVLGAANSLQIDRPDGVFAIVGNARQGLSLEIVGVRNLCSSHVFPRGTYKQSVCLLDIIHLPHACLN
jgi:hypothetical protein